ncbi:MAG: GGDEF domain-containing protein [Blastocatellia bacterium]|nr:GGDEF domain-containing protein [Blastocatellia bacterium]MBL8194633.1 GGDEF domain-containing protein [Blastocatellia bacterium]MBN8724928.1 GGDEF domain-containing protein [Acidobacteriota bacterium]
MDNSNKTQQLRISGIFVPKKHHAALIFLCGDKLGTVVRIDRAKLVIGRDSDVVDLPLDDDVSSRVHAQVFSITTDNGDKQYWLSDLGSTNGTLLNGFTVPQQESRLLQDGDKIKIGRQLFKFAMLDELEVEYQKRVHELIVHDDLTGLLTRKSFSLELEREIVRSQRHRHEFCILMMDIDFFKKVNDTYGHLIGSEVLRHTAKVIQQTLRDSDVLARYGGEEFIAILPETPKDKGAEAAERVREAMEKYNFPASIHDPDSHLHITISIGVADFPNDSSLANNLIEAADFALYEAKQTGRNRVCLHKPKENNNL